VVKQKKIFAGGNIKKKKIQGGNAKLLYFAGEAY
jgi:hypothetical protein